MSLARNIAATLSARLILIAVALASSVFLARFLGPEGRGLFALVLLLPSLVRTFALLGFEEVNGVFAGLEPEGRETLVWHSVAIAGVVGGGVTLVGIAFFILGAPGFPELIKGPLWLYLLPMAVIPASLVVDYWWAILRGMNRIFLINVIEVGAKAASLIVVIIFVGWWRLDVAGAIWANFLVDMIMVILMALLLRNVGVLGRPSLDWALFKRTTKFALPAHAGTVAAFLNYRVAEFIIAALLPPEQLGFYVIAVGIVERLWLLPGAVGRALLPHLTNTSERDPALSAIISRHVVIWTGAACLVLWVFADLLVNILYSSEFAAVVSPLRWLLPGIFALSVGKVLVAELLARKKPYYSLWATGIAVIVNVVVNLSLVPHMGIAGAAIACTISYSLLSVMITWCYLRETGVAWTRLVPCRSDFSTYAEFWRRRAAFVLWRNKQAAMDK
jgi:O-antigen/teichoic acid export membrane protein